MVLLAFLTMDWDCGLHRIQEKVRNLKGAQKGLIIRFFSLKNPEFKN
jgi:hypothetical protein